MTSVPVFRYVTSPTGYRSYVCDLLSKVSREAELELEIRFLRVLRRGSRAVVRRLSDQSLLRLKAYLTPVSLRVRSPVGLPIPVLTVSNTAAVLRGEKLGLYLRVGTMNFSRTAIAYTEVPLHEVVGLLQVEATVVLPPLLSSENVEDPRVDPEDPEKIYHVRAFELPRGHTPPKLISTFCAVVRSGVCLPEVMELRPVTFRYGDDEVLLMDYRDTLPLSRKCMVVRPYFSELGTGGIFVGPRENCVVELRELRPVPELLPVPGQEFKTGANAVLKLSGNEYLLLFHSVEYPHGMYYTYAAVLSDTGELLAVSEEPILSPLPEVYSGRRPCTIFVCGAVKVGDSILVTAGKDDEAVLILETTLDTLLGAVKWLRG